jgi:DNA-binding CsgD family transcriptional regulator/tetratricopeptide (TPR) repeat protein
VAQHLRWLRQAAGVTSTLPAAVRRALDMDRITALLMLGEEEGWAGIDQIPADAPTARERLRITRGNLNVGDQAMVWGRYAEAGKRLATALELAEAHQYPRVRHEVLTTQLHLDWFTGAWAGLAERAEAIIGDSGLPRSVQFEAGLVAGLLHAAAGRAEEAASQFGSVLEQVRGRGAVPYLAEPSGALARLHLAAGRVDEALASTDEAMAVVAGKSIWLWATEIVPVRVSALIAAGRAEEAAELVEAFARGLRGAPAAAAALVTCRALLAAGRLAPDGDLGEAARLFGAAASAWRALPRPYEALLALEQQGECLLLVGASASAVDLLGSVREELSALGASGDADRVAGRLREHGVAVPQVWRGGQRGYGDQLSPRELEVVRLVSEGLTNREIAEALRRSPNTVDSQLRSAMRKLKVSTRTALAVKAIEVGAVPGDRPAK